MAYDHIIDTLNDLIETCKDGEYGFSACAKHVESIELRNQFQARAAECRLAAEELRDRVIEYGGKGETGGSTAGAFHRGWVAVRGSLLGFTDEAMLEECERGEDVAKTRYRKALESGYLPESLRPMVQRQYRGVERNHDLVKALRDRAHATM